jgi:hypothetical protein
MAVALKSRLFNINWRDIGLGCAVLVCHMVHPCGSHTTAHSVPTHTARSAPASQDDLKTFALDAVGYRADPRAAPVNSTINSKTRTTAAAAVARSAIVQSPGTIVQAGGGIVAPAGVSLPPALDWDDLDAPFDVGIQLDFHAPAKPLCPLDSDNNELSSSSDDDSIFIDLSRD